MKGAVLFLYVFIALIYLSIGEGRIWGGVYHIDQFFTIAVLAYWTIKHEKYTKIERFILGYCIFFEFGLSIFTAACISAPKDWVNAHTIHFTEFMGAVFVGILIYAWIKYKYELGEY